MVVCEGRDRNEDNNDKIQDLTQLIQNIAFFTSSHLNIKIVTNYRDTDQLHSIKVDASKISLSVNNVMLPPDLEEMTLVYKPCVSAKIFLHDMFPDDDAGLVLDTDIIILEDLSKLWNMFQQFDHHQLAALAPVETHYSNVHNIPYYGPPGLGLNAGIIMFNFTRMRNMVGGGFTESIRYQ